MQKSLSDPLDQAQQDLAVCRRLICAGSRTFYAASLLLPDTVRMPAYGLYAFCRLSDDAVDLEAGSPRTIERLKERLDLIYANTPSESAADRAMADLVQRFGIPQAVPLALIEGLGWDAEGRRYQTIEDLYDYAARVAGTVGTMMSLLMGARNPSTLASACHLGIAMQLTNIARDVGEDARNGRLYLPLDWMREAGLDPDRFVQSPEMSDALRSVIVRLLQAADRLYAQAATGIADLPLGCRPAILAARYIYADIGRALEALEHDSVSQRAHVSNARKIRILAASLLRTPLLRGSRDVQPLAAVRFLIESVPAQAPAAEGQSRQSTPAGRLARVLELFDRLERADRRGRGRWIPSTTA
jgi:phytoene synthase